MPTNQLTIDSGEGNWSKLLMYKLFVYLHCTLASCDTVYCNRSCLWVYVCVSGCVCLFVGLLPRYLEIECIDLHQTRFVGEGSDNLQLIKFWPSRAPGKRSAVGRKFLAPPYYSQRAVFVSLSAFFHFICAHDNSKFCGVWIWMKF